MASVPILVVAFVAVPLLEIWLFLTVGSRIGLGSTLLLVLITALVGAFLVRGQGISVARRAASAVRAGRFPGVELAHGAMVLFGGALLLTPGFATDAVGLALMVPGVRERLRRFGARRMRSRNGVIDI